MGESQKSNVSRALFFFFFFFRNPKHFLGKYSLCPLSGSVVVFIFAKG